MDTLTVRLNETRSPGRIYRWIDFAGQTVWWEFQGPEDVLPPALARHDMVATCLVFYAMKRGVSLHIEGPVSRTLLENMEELIACWTVWRPDLYRRTKIIVVNMPDAQERRSRFSRFADRAQLSMRASSSKIWVISLASAASRRDAFAANAPSSVDWAFFDAHGSLGSELAYDESACRRTLLRALRPGELGCYSSHVALWQWLVNSSCRQMVVLEDDVVVDWPFVMELLARDLPALKIDYLRLFGKVPFRWRYIATRFVDNYHHLLHITGFALGTQGYLITREGAWRMLTHAGQVNMPIDVYMDSVWKHGVMNLAIYPFPVFERFQPSSIGDARLSGRAGQGLLSFVQRARRKLRVWLSVYGPDPAGARALRRRLLKEQEAFDRVHRNATEVESCKPCSTGS